MGWYQTGYQLLGLYQKLLRCTGVALQWCRLVADQTKWKAGCLLPAHFRTMALCIPIARKWVDTKQVISCLGCIRSCYGVLALRFCGSRLVAANRKKSCLFPAHFSRQAYPFPGMALCKPIARKWVGTKQSLGCIRSLALRFSGTPSPFLGNGSVTHCSEMALCITHCSEMGWYQTGYQLLGLYQKLLRCTGFAFQWCRLVADHTNRKGSCLLPAHFRTMALCIPIARKWVGTKQVISCLGCIRSCYSVLALRLQW